MSAFRDALAVAVWAGDSSLDTREQADDILTNLPADWQADIAVMEARRRVRAALPDGWGWTVYGHRDMLAEVTGIWFTADAGDGWDSASADDPTEADALNALAAKLEALPAADEPDPPAPVGSAE